MRPLPTVVPNGADRRLNVLYEWIESGQSPYTDEGTIIFLQAIYNDLLGVGGDEVTRYQPDPEAEAYAVWCDRASEGLDTNNVQVMNRLLARRVLKTVAEYLRQRSS